jgi:hypothetical protein
MIRFFPETHAKRQATQHGCLPSLLGDGDKEIEVVYGEEKIPLWRQRKYIPELEFIPQRSRQRRTTNLP